MAQVQFPKWTQFEVPVSSSIRHFEYDPETGILLAHFETNKVKICYDITETDFENLITDDFPANDSLLS